MGKVRLGEISINMKIHHIKASILGNNLYLALMLCKCNVKALGLKPAWTSLSVGSFLTSSVWGCHKKIHEDKLCKGLCYMLKI